MKVSLGSNFFVESPQSFQACNIIICFEKFKYSGRRLMGSLWARPNDLNNRMNQTHKLGTKEFFGTGKSGSI
jgi:hypothetical protein